MQADRPTDIRTDRQAIHTHTQNTYSVLSCTVHAPASNHPTFDSLAEGLILQLYETAKSEPHGLRPIKKQAVEGSPPSGCEVVYGRLDAASKASQLLGCAQGHSFVFPAWHMGGGGSFKVVVLPCLGPRGPENI